WWKAVEQGSGRGEGTGEQGSGRGEGTGEQGSEGGKGTGEQGSGGGERQLKQAGIGPNGNEALEVSPPMELYVGKSSSPLLWLLLTSDQHNRDRL
ncbi:hypothetical protein LEMLEM_LOCUS13627, partial [Lemmus lemmus]